MTAPRSPLSDRLAAIRVAMVAKAGEMQANPARVPPALVEALGAERAAALVDGAVLSRQWQAIHNRDEVGRMSRDGVPVARIAAELSLSRRHVVAIRALLGVGRRRR